MDQIEGLAAFTPEAFIGAGGSATEGEPGLSVRSWAGSQCLIVKRRGRARTGLRMREKGGHSSGTVMTETLLTLKLCGWRFDISGFYSGCQEGEIYI